MTFKKWFGCKKSVADDVTKQNISTRVAEINNEFLKLYNFEQSVMIWILMIFTQISWLNILRILY